MAETLIRRRRLTIVGVEQRPLAGQLVSRVPFVVRTEGFELKGFFPPVGVGKKHLARVVEEPRPCRILTDNEGGRHYFWCRDDSTNPQVWCFSWNPNGFARSYPEGVEITSFTPSGAFDTERILYERALTMNVGDELGWEYPFQEVTRMVRLRSHRVLACGGASSFYLPLEVLDNTRTARAPWPEYVRKLTRQYATGSKWRGLIRSLEGKYYHGLFARGAPITRAITALTKGGSGSPSRRQSPVYCFNGNLPILEGEGEGAFRVVPRIAWGDKGDLAWIYQLGGKTVLVLVDRPESDRAAWVFADEEGAAQLLAELPLGADWRVRHEGLKAHAIHYCPHQGAWQDRLALLVLRVLAHAGSNAATAAFDALAATKIDVAKHVRSIFDAYLARRSD